MSDDRSRTRIGFPVYAAKFGARVLDQPSTADPRCASGSTGRHSRYNHAHLYNSHNSHNPHNRYNPSLTSFLLPAFRKAHLPLLSLIPCINSSISPALTTLPPSLNGSRNALSLSLRRQQISTRNRTANKAGKRKAKRDKVGARDVLHTIKCQKRLNRLSPW